MREQGIDPLPALKMALRQGFIHDAALANERYGDFLLFEVGDREEAVSRLEEVVKLYEEWEARAKANRLLQKYKELWNFPSTVVCSGK
jgi:hypothetical protein